MTHWQKKCPLCRIFCVNLDLTKVTPVKPSTLALGYLKSVWRQRRANPSATWWISHGPQPLVLMQIVCTQLPLYTINLFTAPRWATKWAPRARGHRRRRRRASLHHWSHISYTPCFSMHMYRQTKKNQYCPWWQITRTKSRQNKNKPVVYDVRNNTNTLHAAACVISEDRSNTSVWVTLSASAAFQSQTQIHKANGENGDLLRNARNPTICTCSSVTQFQAFGMAERGKREREGEAAEKAHAVPVCQQSSCFIIYLRAEIGGWARWKDGECVWRTKDEEEKKWFWVREKDDVLLFSTLLIYTSHYSAVWVCSFVCISICDIFLTQVLIVSAEIKLQWDVTSARCLHSCIFLEERDKGVHRDVVSSSSHTTVQIRMHATRLGWICHKSSFFMLT